LRTHWVLVAMDQYTRRIIEFGVHAGTVLRREYLDDMLFWTKVDLENKLLDFRTYFNHYRTHTSREGQTPDPPASGAVANPRSFRWQPHCRALYQTPVAA